MTAHLDAVTMSHTATTTWTSRTMSLLIAAAALSVALFAQGSLPEQAEAAQPMGVEAPSMAMLLVPSPQPGGLGEPELVPAELPQSY